MQIKSLRIQSYRSWRIDDTTPKEAFERLEKLERYRQLRKEYQVPEAVALEIIGWSRSSYYRWRQRYQTRGVKGLAARSTRPRRRRQSQRTRQHEQQVLSLRRQNPC